MPLIRAGLAVVVALALAGCGSFGAGPVPANAPIVHFVNATSVEVELRVNGVPRGRYPAWTPEQQVAIFEPGGPPWRVAFFDPDGFEMAGIEVDGPARPGDGASSSLRSTCGMFVAWWGGEPMDKPVFDPAGPPPPGPPCR